MKINQVFDVIISGAGASGLSLGFHLKALNISYIILEKDQMVGSSWATMPKHLKLITFWHSNKLLEKHSSYYHSNDILSAIQFQAYLERFKNEEKIEVLFGQKVLNVEKSENLFLIKTQDQTFQAKVYINAHGYYSFPFIPDYRVSGEHPRLIHFNQFTSAPDYQSCKKILIVGKRLSAGQIISEFYNANSNVEIFLSCRGPVKFSAPQFFLTILMRYLTIFEFVLSLFIKKKSTFEIPMNKEVEPIINKNVEICTDIDTINGKAITFIDGKIVSGIDLIIFTTGYKRFEEIRDDFESSQYKNFFYLGLSAQRTFKSRFLRGIREDAPILAQLIRGRLDSKNNSQ